MSTWLTKDFDQQQNYIILMFYCSFKYIIDDDNDMNDNTIKFNKNHEFYNRKY